MTVVLMLMTMILATTTATTETIVVKIPEMVIVKTKSIASVC